MRMEWEHVGVAASICMLVLIWECVLCMVLRPALYLSLDTRTFRVVPWLLLCLGRQYGAGIPAEARPELEQKHCSCQTNSIHRNLQPGPPQDLSLTAMREGAGQQATVPRDQPEGVQATILQCCNDSTCHKASWLNCRPCL